MAELSRVLIANRGEIAVRIVRALRDAGLTSIAVYADPDADAVHTRLADEALALPGTSPAETYLSIEALLDAARRAHADAVHPGYGFLSENADFARAVERAGLTWIGPRAETIEALGNKVRARELAASVGTPLAPGSDGPVESWEDARDFAQEHGLPIAIKAAFGGGGRGLKVARSLDSIESSFIAAQREAEAAFGRGECFVEKFLDRPRHVEAQILADEHGHTVVVGLRDCSLQRRNQKLIEEAPAPFLTAEQEERLRAGAVAVCEAAGYVGAGTVEFLVGEDGTISFLEVNTRLQVEHPVTEETSGVDLVAEQLRIAAGEPLSVSEAPAPRGHALEFRLNAEDAVHGFVPSPGTVTRFEAPTGPGIRMDSGVRTGSEVPGAYDSLMAKLIVVGADRQQALSRARAALDELVIEGVATVVPFDAAVLEHPDFTAEDGFAVHTRWIETDFAEDEAAQERMTDRAAGAVLPAHGGAQLRRFGIEIDGRRREIALPAEALALLAGRSGPAGGAGEGAGGVQSDRAQFGGNGGGAAGGEDSGAQASETAVTSPYAGSFVAFSVSDGDEVEAGQAVAVIEAMKMESEALAPAAGTVRLRDLAKGDEVAAGQVLAELA
ncbi:ATP-grasp domain-containing protein [Brevibacterium sp. BRM-1]|uniref:acetyl/propionyl/methylcrotonyl-CoA carboxylase subunit alpha n=1 Tax=Brevibacterium sp. BRM-1 TaxID=2999062 RepID=UPI002281B37B|nr:biotin carboxylase N-terminal domain-containing protein [Brevibacterium sp. BRM-1]WAL39935.1 ATP-grasp domain-containing protein [Brevibacterium sp. BRM-1]